MVTKNVGTFWRYEYTRWFKYDRDDLCVNKSQFVPVIFEPPCTLQASEYKILNKNLSIRSVTSLEDSVTQNFVSDIDHVVRLGH
jgi:hypothetical protein